MLGRRDILRTLITLPSAAGQMFGEAPALRPYLQDVSAGEATLLWPPDGAAESSIEWTSGDRAWTHCSAALREALPQDEAGGWPPPQASARLTGLPPGSTVSYRVSDEPGIVHRFRTPRKEPAPFRFLAFGDSGAGTEEQFELARRMEAEGADFCVHTGDVVYPIPTPEGIRQRYLDCYRDLMASGPMYVCLGNHDYAAERGVPFLRVHSFPGVPGAPREDEGRYYSFEWNSARIIALDSNLLADGVPARESERMLRWLDGELERPAFWRIVFFHHPPYTLGKHADDPICAEVMRRLAPRLERAGVQLVLNGHDHNYQRFDPIRGTVYCVTGGGGGGLYPVTPHPRHAASAELYHFVRVDVSGWRLKMTAVGLNGEPFDAAEIAPAPRLNDGGPVNLADYTSGVAPEGLAAFFGTQLALAPNGETPEVTVGGLPAKVLFAAPGQMNVLLPAAAPGLSEVTVRTPNGTVKSTITLMESAPALFRNEAGVALTDREAVAGTGIAAYATGLGRGTVEVECGGTLLPATVTREADHPGVLAVAFRLPVGLRGSIALRLRASGAWSRPALLVIH